MGPPAIDWSQVPPQLAAWVEEAVRAGELVITRGGEVVAKIVPVESERRPRRPGSARGQIHMADDFDTTPEEFGDYL